MIKKTAIAVFPYLLSSVAFAQLTVSNFMTPQQLVQNVLIGTGVTVNNITYTGGASAIGSFNGSASNIGLASGVLLTSGDINQAPGPNNSSSAGIGNGLSGDADLDAICASQTHDASVLEFDFTPASDTVKFRYVFGSEEYPEWVGSFNDVFAFFISGPGIAGTKNIALIPGTATPVSINNVNATTNSLYYVNNTNGATVQYDGFTTVLTAWQKVTPCQSYHIKIAIADAGDDIYDSGVFLEASSFSSNIITLNATTPNADSSSTEGCSGTTVSFALPAPASSDVVVHYSFAGTAVNGQDFPLLPDSAIIPAGQDSVDIFINPVFDGINEATETVILIVQTSLCEFDSITLYIKDTPTLTLSMPSDITICIGDSTLIAASASGGLQPLSYSWNNNAGNDSVETVTPQTTTTYAVTVTDSCGTQSITDSLSVIVSIPPAADFSYSYHTVAELAFANKTSGGVNYLWDFGDNSSPALQQDPVHVYADTGLFTVTMIAINAEGCSDTIQHEVIVHAEFSLYVPNAFTPNNDNTNDIFLPFGAGVSKIDMLIENRWGQVFFHTQDINKGWDGRDTRGAPAPEGAYVYVISAESFLGKKYGTSGTVSLIR